MKLAPSVFTLVVVFLGVALLVCVAGIIWLSGDGKNIPDILQNVVSAVVAGMIGLLATKDQP